MKVAVVVPTIRPERIDSWLDSWRKEFESVDAIVHIVHDSPDTWVTIDKVLKDRGAIISRQNAGIRIWGFLKALADGADVILSLDDDVLPSGRCIARHVKNLTEPHIEDAWTQVCPFRTRGLPYHKLDRSTRAVVSHGLWTGTPDLDASTQLVQPALEITRFDTSFKVPRGLYFPMSSMNVAFTREIAPALYFAPMGPSQPFDRFEDIWAGIVAKKVCDHLGLTCLNGAPLVHHTRASDPFVNLVKEATGVQENERFWTVVDRAQLTELTVANCVREIASEFLAEGSTYYRTYGRNLLWWCDLVEAS